MRLAALSAAVLGVGMIASASQAAFTYTVTTTPIAGQALDRVNLYALSNNGGDLFAGDVNVSTTVANGIKFSVVDTDGDGSPDTLSYKYTASQTPDATTRSRVSNIVFGTAAPGFPAPDPSVSLQPYIDGLTSVEFVGFDGRDATTTDVGVKAGSDQNSGKGAAVMSIVVPSGAIVNFAGTLGDDLQGSSAYALAASNAPTNVPEPTTLAAMGLAALGLVRRRK